MDKNQSPALQQQGQKLSVIGEFQQALKAAKISSEGDTRIVETLKIIMLKLGIREANLPSNAEKMVLLDHIRANYSMHTLTEVKLAFDLAIAGKLECEADHYENFSCLYFSKIMKAYREWSGRTYKELPQEKPNEIPAPVEKITDQEMIEFYSARFLDKSLFSYQNIMLLPFELYDKMEINLSDEDKSRIKLQATLRMQMLENEDKDFLGGVDREKFFRRLCKKIAIGEKINKTKVQ